MFWRYNDINFDESGFWPRDMPSNKVRWLDITRVAQCYEIHSFAVSDWDYWAFKTHDATFFVWVEINDQTSSKGFSNEVHRRFGSPDIPPMRDWVDSDSLIRTYVIWPQAEMGKSLYFATKKRWWSSLAEQDYQQ
jgi:hypothetical protein